MIWVVLGVIGVVAFVYLWVEFVFGGGGDLDTLTQYEVEREAFERMFE